MIACVDEAGRGPLAGDVVAACCIIGPNVDIKGIHDSKKLTEEEREILFEKITNHPDITYAYSVIDHHTIDSINILQATMLAMRTAVEKLKIKPDYILIDGNRCPEPLPCAAEWVIKGDSKVYGIA